MDSLQSNYIEEDDEDDESVPPTTTTATTITATSTITPPRTEPLVPTDPQPSDAAIASTPTDPEDDVKEERVNNPSDEDEPISDDVEESPNKPTQTDLNTGPDPEPDEEEDPPPKKQKQLSSLTLHPSSHGQSALLELTANTNGSTPANGTTPSTSNPKKSKKKNNNVWVTKSTRKGKKKSKNNNNHNTPVEDPVLITPVPRFPDKNDDNPDSKICLSKVYKAEKVELSEDRMSAGSTKGYRMVRATRGVVEGAWYFEIRVVKLGETGHTRLGWSTEKGDLQAPVGYDGNSFGYRDVDGSKVHKALREKYGDEGYKEGDVLGCYINLPEGEKYAPKPPHLVWYKGQRYVCAPDVKEDPPKVVPESEISFFKNGVCQGVAFKDLFGGRYYPVASMYTLPNQPNCTVKFNFGPDFEFFPQDFSGHPLPRPMIEVPYHGFDSRAESNGVSPDKKK